MIKKLLSITGPIQGCTLIRDIDANGVIYNKGSIIDAVIPEWGVLCLINTINTAIDWAFMLLLVIAVAIIALAGFMLMLSRGNPEGMGTAGKMIAAVLVGIVIVLLARMIPAVVTGILI